MHDLLCDEALKGNLRIEVRDVNHYLEIHTFVWGHRWALEDEGYLLDELEVVKVNLFKTLEVLQVTSNVKLATFVAPPNIITFFLTLRFWIDTNLLFVVLLHKI